MDINNLANLDLKSLLVYDIETARSYNELSDAPAQFAESWNLMHTKKNLGERYASPEESYLGESGLYPAFSNIVAISLGSWVKGEIVVKNMNYCDMSDDDERKIVEHFMKILTKYPQVIIGGFNITGFDNPFMVRKSIKHEIQIPLQLQIWAKKPWEQQVFDLFTFWKMSSFSGSGPGYVSLDAICLEMGVTSPKDGISGADVGDEFWKGNCDEIAEYCGKDVKATMEVIENIKNQLRV